jgi:hypothetical protein
MGFVVYLIFSVAQMQSNGTQQVTSTGTYATPLIIADTAGTNGSLGRWANVKIAVVTGGGTVAGTTGHGFVQ